MRKEDASRHMLEVLKIVNSAEQTKRSYQAAKTTSASPQSPLNRAPLTEADAFPSNVRNQGNGPDDVGPWLARLSARARMVCAISVPHTAIRGTGFLIDRDLVLTCFHVIRPVLENDGFADKLEIIFDRESRTDRTGHEAGVSYSLAADGFLGSYSEDDEKGHDFVVLRIDGRPGDDRRGGPIRGWVNLADEIEVERGLLVTHVHHPDDTRLLLSFGVVLERPDEDGVLSHDARSFAGSSGGLLLNNFGRFVAMHRGDPNGGPPTNPLSRRALFAPKLVAQIKERPMRSPVD